MPPTEPESQGSSRVPPPDRLDSRPGTRHSSVEGKGEAISKIHMGNVEIGRVLVDEIGLTGEQAAAFIAVTTGGRMSAPEIAKAAGIPPDAARAAAESLISAGAFIDMPGGTYEAMHPRFTAVNMYRRACERSGRPFGRNNAVDMVGAALEGAYDAARTG